MELIRPIMRFGAQNILILSFQDRELSAELNVKSALGQNASPDLRSGLVLNELHLSKVLQIYSECL